MVRQESINVLHVDEEPDLAETAATYLSYLADRISVDTATNTNEGLAQLAAKDYDCIVSDYEMPGQDGIEFLKTVREADREIPFILFSVYGSEVVACDAISAGVTDYIQKGQARNSSLCWQPASRTSSRRCSSRRGGIPPDWKPKDSRQDILQYSQHIFPSVNTAPDEAGEMRETSTIRPKNRLDEALKQIRIVNEYAESDIETELQTASEALESARANLADD